MLPGESFHSFSQRVNALARERLALQGPKMTHPSAKRKDFYDKKKQHKRDKGAAAEAMRAAKAALMSSGNPTAIKRARTGGLDLDEAVEVAKRTDVVEFGERVEAPPTLPSVVFLNKMKARWEHKAALEKGVVAARAAAGSGRGFGEHAS
jgi:hypothetical protein